jgi:uncharacterized protein YkwD
MRSFVAIAHLFLGLLLLTYAAGASSGSGEEGIPSPRSGRNKSVAVYQQTKAQRLFLLAQKANPRLRWDDCLAEAARRRAVTMVRQRYFDHQDPQTGIKPAWDLVKACHRCQYAGENLTRGDETPELLHEVLMQSARHRQNILEPKYRMMGVGCYRDVCVELFAGF